MNTENRKKCDILVEFWNNALTMTPEYEEAYRSCDIENDWTGLAPSEKLCKAVMSLKDCENMLDYGCGDGWACITAAKAGCKNVTGADVIANGIDYAKTVSEIFKVADKIDFKKVSETWIGEEPAGKYDAVVCSNVLDVLPAEAASYILENIARITAKNAVVIIGLNFYRVSQSNPDRGIEVKNGNEEYVNGVLRLVARTDEEWTAEFEKYFTVEKLDHFAWEGEEKETRRLFILKKK